MEAGSGRSNWGDVREDTFVCIGIAYIRRSKSPVARSGSKALFSNSMLHYLELVFAFALRQNLFESFEEFPRSHRIE